jgi:hypothetical protein
MFAERSAMYAKRAQSLNKLAIGLLVVVVFSLVVQVLS